MRKIPGGFFIRRGGRSPPYEGGIASLSVIASPKRGVAIQIFLMALEIIWIAKSLRSSQ